MLFTIMRYDIYILRERTLKKNSFLSLKIKTKNRTLNCRPPGKNVRLDGNFRA